jgi:urease accessory protein UreF
LLQARGQEAAMQTKACGDNEIDRCVHAIFPVFEAMICAALNSGHSEQKIAAALMALAQANHENVTRRS